MRTIVLLTKADKLLQSILLQRLQGLFSITPALLYSAGVYFRSNFFRLYPSSLQWCPSARQLPSTPSQCRSLPEAHHCMTPNFTCRAVQDHVSAKMMRIQQVQGRQVVVRRCKKPECSFRGRHCCNHLTYSCGKVGQSEIFLMPCRTASSDRMSKLPKSSPSPLSASTTFLLKPQRGASGDPCHDKHNYKRETCINM